MRPDAVKSICVDPVRCRADNFRQLSDEPAGRVDARLRFRGAGFRSAAQPLDFAPHLVRQSLMLARLRADKLGLAIEKLAVIAFDPKQSAGIEPGQLDHIGSDVFEKVAVVADHHAREGRGFEKALEPQDAVEIEVIGRLVEQQNIGMAEQRAGDRQAPLPSAGERVGRGVGVFEAGLAERHRNLRIAIRAGGQRLLENLAHRQSGGKGDILRDVSEPRSFANRD